MDTYVHSKPESRIQSTLEQGPTHRSQAASSPEARVGSENTAPITEPL